MTVVITRAKEDSPEFIKILEAKGIIDYFFFPCLAFTAPDDGYAALDAATRRNQEFDWLVFLSRRAAESFFNRLLEIGGHFFHLAPHLKIAVIGSATKEFIEKEINFPVNFCPSEFNSEVFSREFLRDIASSENILEPLNLLIPRTSIADDVLTQDLESLGTVKVTQVDAYKTIKPEASKELLADFQRLLDVDLLSRRSIISSDAEHGTSLSYTSKPSQRTTKLSFTSSQCVRNFFEIIDGQINLATYHEVLEFHSIGPKVTQTLKDVIGDKFKIFQTKEASLEAFFT
ncbi:MAG: uroporphyrinogen-III synthase [Vampirovibrionia bacterium]